MFEDPLFILSCDLPVGWVATLESGLFRLVLEHVHRAERMELSVHSSVASRIHDDDLWVAAAREHWKLPDDATRVDLGGATGIEAQWQDGAVWRTRIARRGASLDIVLDHTGDAPDDRNHRGLLALVAGTLLPAIPDADRTATQADAQSAVAAVDAAAQGDGEEFRQALVNAANVLADRWQSSLAQGIEAADITALTELVKVGLRHASGAAETRRLMQVQSMVLRACPLNPAVGDYVPVDANAEQQANDALAPALPILATVFERIRQANGESADASVARLRQVPLRLTMAHHLMRQIRRELAAAGEDYDREDALACAREIVDAALLMCIDVKVRDVIPVEALLAAGEPLVLFLDAATAADRMQDVAEAGAVLTELATRALDLAHADDRARSSAYRFLVIGTVAQANALVSVADEASLRDALDLLDVALESASKSSDGVAIDVLNIRHLQAMAALQLGDVDRARTAHALGAEAAANARDDYQIGFFAWVSEVLEAIEAEEPRPRTIPDFELALQRTKNQPLDLVLDRLCRSLLASIEENPLSLTTLERLYLASSVVDPARANLEAAARALLDLRRLLLERSSELRIGADDSLLARQLAAGNVESVLSERGVSEGALAVDRACGRSLVLDLARQPSVVSRIRDAIRRRYADAAAVSMERMLREQRPSAFGAPPPWALMRGPSWLRHRSDQLRHWCGELTGVVGGTPMTEAEMHACTERHGEPILLLYPVAGTIGAFLLRPGMTPHFRSTTARAEDVLRAIDDLSATLGLWKSARSRNAADWTPSTDAVQNHWAVAGSLFEQLLGPVDAELSGETRLTIVPYRELAAIPFGVLPDAAGRPLSERFALTIVPSISTIDVLQRREARQHSGRAFVLGDPDTRDTSVPRLPAAAEEARDVDARLRAARPAWDVRYAHDEGATVAAYRTLAADADLVHLACHGSVGNVARDSALLFSPNDGRAGLLRSSDIEAVPLRSALVFLSACRTGAGRPTADGTIGLARSFLAAGADAVIGSLWNVPDLATRMLVESFYDVYLSGADVATSLQRATIATRDALASQLGYPSPNDVHPAEWGAFFVLGKGTVSHGAS